MNPRIFALLPSVILLGAGCFASETSNVVVRQEPDSPPPAVVQEPPAPPAAGGPVIRDLGNATSYRSDDYGFSMELSHDFTFVREESHDFFDDGEKEVDVMAQDPKGRNLYISIDPVATEAYFAKVFEASLDADGRIVLGSSHSDAQVTMYATDVRNGDHLYHIALHMGPDGDVPLDAVFMDLIAGIRIR